MTLLRGNLWDPANAANNENLEDWRGPHLVGVQGTPLKVRGFAKMTVSIANKAFKPDVVVVEDLSAEAILGRDFLEKHDCTLDLAKRTLRFGDRTEKLPLAPPEPEMTEQMCARVTPGETRQIPALSELEVMADITTPHGCTWMLEGKTKRSSVIVARAIVRPDMGKFQFVCLIPGMNQAQSMPELSLQGWKRSTNQKVLT